MYVARDQLYVSRSRGRPVRLPDTRTEFYQEILNELLLFRRGEQIQSEPVGSQVKRRRETLLGQISLAHLKDREQAANSISWDLAVMLTKDFYANETDAQAESELRRLALETGIFSEERKNESLRFLHLTLCEFLAAKELRESDLLGLSSVVQTVIEDERESRTHRLLEVAVFAISLVGRAHRLQILREVLARPQCGPPELFLRVIHENSETSREILLGALDRIAEGVVGSSFESEVQKFQIYLLLLCFSNVEPIRRSASGDALGVDYVVRRLVDEDRLVRFDTIFPLYLRVRPADAVAEAHDRGLATSLLVSATLVESLQDPALIAYAVEKFDEQPEVWAVALAEAALRYPLVAQILHTSSPQGIVADMSRQIHGWLSHELLRGTLYGEVLNRATESFVPDSGVSMNLSLLARYNLDRIGESLEPGLTGILNLEDTGNARIPDAQSSRKAVLVLMHADSSIDFWVTKSMVGHAINWDEHRSGRIRGRSGDQGYDLIVATDRIPLDLFIYSCLTNGAVTYLPHMKMPDDMIAHYPSVKQKSISRIRLTFLRRRYRARIRRIS